MPTSLSLYVGLMSGTSADGIDAALVQFGDAEGARFELLTFETIELPRDLREEILAVCDVQIGTVESVCRLDAVLGAFFAEAALKVMASGGVSSSDVRAIGSHGQTIHHLPDEPDRFGVTARSTLQIGNASVIAERTGTQVVSDFRSRDISAGGQGAPLVPLVDYLLFRDESVGRVLINIGGIANVTVLPAGCGPGEVLAFDTGPGNVILDGLVSRWTRGEMIFDEDGRIADTGKVQENLLARWMRHPYFEQPPPRSTGREMFSAAYIEELIRESGGATMNDLIATATAFTAETIVSSLRRYVPDYGGIGAFYVSGGGSANRTLMRSIQERVGDAPVRLSDALGLSADSKEAVAFALLAHRTLNGLVGNLPAATGASRAVILGQVTPAGHSRLI